MVTDCAEIVHDLKTPLAVIELEAELIRQDLAACPPSVRAAIYRIRENVAFMDRLVRDLLDRAALDDGELAIQRHPTELSSLIAETVERSVPAAERTRVCIEVRESVTVSVDELRIQRVVANLVDNALKHAPRDTRVTVRLERTGELACVSVIDGGPGLDAHQTAYLFDKFTRASKADGTGLGLYISRQIVEAHGGEVGYARDADASSRFFFALPAASP